jgi:hypothetical protein
MLCTPDQMLGDKIKKNGMGRVCSVCGGKRDVCRDWWGNLRRRGHLEDLDFHRRIILE